MEPTPIYAALVDPGAHGDDRADGRPVVELLRAQRDVPDGRDRVGHVPDLLSFPPPGTDPSVIGLI